MPRHALQAAQSESIDDRCGPWRIAWRPGEFVIPAIGSFPFKKVVLPIEVVGDEPHDSGCLVVTLEDGFRIAILHGSRLLELRVVKRLVSGAVLSALGNTSACFECAKDAGAIPRMWSGSDCVGCRRPYCRNPFCLRRLEADDARDGRQECWSCRASAELVGRG